MDQQPTILLELLSRIYDTPWIRGILGLLILNLVTGIAVACYRTDRRFYLGDLGDWLVSRALPYILVAGGLQLVLALLAGYEAVLGDYSQVFRVTSGIVWGFVVLSMLGHIAQNLRDMGFPIPEQLTASPKPKTTSAP